MKRFKFNDGVGSVVELAIIAAAIIAAVVIPLLPMF